MSDGCAVSSAAANPSVIAAPTASAILVSFLMIESPLNEVWNSANPAPVSLLRGRIGSHYATPM
jgi:hypothetical protein